MDDVREVWYGSRTTLRFSFAFLGDFERYRDVTTVDKVRFWTANILARMHNQIAGTCQSQASRLSSSAMVLRQRFGVFYNCATITRMSTPVTSDPTLER